ncbi:hypothetical protein VTL71DRAFT_636 [Oculimacula yallundae]|uniref:Uncharacterized protein n=1 Tax=Oculimacula yallundae TaxID=86028 RepID=A0ABR4D0K6_9HELO
MTKGVSPKRARDLALVELNRGQMVQIESDDEPTQPAKLKSKKSKKAKGKTSRLATVEDYETSEEDDDQDELGELQQRVVLTKRLKPQPRKTFKNLAAAAEFLSTMDSVAEIEKFMQQNGFSTDEDVKLFAEHCGTIAKLLRTKIERSKGEATATVSGEIEPMEMFYMLRDGNRGFKLLAPLEVLTATNTVKDKVFGAIRHRGKYWPLMYAVSGTKNIIPEHPKLLDSELWNQLAFDWGTQFGQKFRSNGWEAYRGVATGFESAGHIEPKLMLWLACQEWMKLSKKRLPLEKTVKMLFELQDLPQVIEVEIIQDRVPCDCCKKFKKRLEKFTGKKLKFKFLICPNVAVMDSVVSKHGARVNLLPKLQNELEDESEEFDVPHRHSRVASEARRSLQVLIRSGPSTPPENSADRPGRVVIPEHDSLPVTRTCTVIQKDRIRSFSYQSTSSALTRPVIEIESSDESDWQPSSTLVQSKKKLINLTTPSNSSRSYGLPTPAQTLFPEKAYHKAAELRNTQKRRRDDAVDGSPSVSKKLRHRKY